MYARVRYIRRWASEHASLELLQSMRILRLTKTKIAAIVPLVAAMAYPALFGIGHHTFLSPKRENVIRVRKNSQSVNKATAATRMDLTLGPLYIGSDHRSG